MPLAPYPTPSPTNSEAASAEDLQRQLEQTIDEFNELSAEVQELDQKLRMAALRQSQTKAQLGQARRAVGTLAAEAYRRGPTTVFQLLSAPDEDTFLFAAAYLDSRERRHVTAVQHLEAQAALLSRDEQLIRNQHSSRSQARTALNDRKGSIERLLRQVQEAAAQTPTPGTAPESTPSSPQAPNGAAVSDQCAKCEQIVAAASARVAPVLAFACAQLGEPYKWGAEGPGAWDCSGLTMKAWAQSGVRLPHSSRLQAQQGTSVPLDQLQPGDLVFFHSPISHVAIYAGSGLMLDAPQTGERVTLKPIRRSVVRAVRL